MTLSRGPVARVDHCPQCNVISIHLGATSIRLEPAAYEALWGTLSHALRVLRGLTEAPEATPTMWTSSGGSA
ncbi:MULTISPECIES: hypothetical protein [Polyangium]|uniref:Uncharacterized protein n=2 Tax=Polyangium TaxID=55 RepID=A0A4U1JCA3_9BACT|nr:MULTISPECIES: hypothetical protein [Polyangium]MDI1434281.1 hypothetical protein [Polyangium sorediatum]TKD07934.1 hypothetical protein E8A74_16760 [Polyangium fumosum]